MRKLYAIPMTSTLYLLIISFSFIFLSPSILSMFSFESAITQAKTFFIVTISLICLGIICGIAGIVSSIVCLARKHDSLAMAKTAMIVKLCLAPAYVILFCLGVIFAITIFTIGFAIVIIVADFCVLLITGFFNTAAIIRAIKEGKTTFKKSWWYILLQFIYCADVVASVMFYRKLKKLYSEETLPTEG